MEEVEVEEEELEVEEVEDIITREEAVWRGGARVS